MIKKIYAELTAIKEMLSLRKKMWNIDEFCMYTGISKAYAYHLTSTRKIKFYRPFGKVIFFNADEVIEFLQQNPMDTIDETNAKASKLFIKK